MSEKNCTQCGDLKPYSDFSKQKTTNDGMRHACKQCDAIKSAAYRKTKEGLISRIYGNQRMHSKKRGDTLPSYSRKELREWCLSQPVFHELFDDWVNSGYQKMLVPSFDRMDDYKKYSLNRLRITTWQDNKKKGEEDRKNGINNKMSKAVIQSSLNNNLTTEYFSGLQASRDTGIDFRGISKCCNRKQKTAGGFFWSFA